MEATLKWNENFKFTANNHGHETILDLIEEQGGTDQGPNPKEQVLNAMMTCAALDAVIVLKKMRSLPKTFDMKIEVEKNEKPPIHFTKAKLSFILTGDTPAPKAIKAIESSLTKYCGVNYMISKVCDISWELILNDKIEGKGRADFIDP